MIVCGVDPSLSQTAIVIGTGLNDMAVYLCRTKPLGDTCMQRTTRYDQLVSEVVRCISGYPGVTNGADVHIFLEGYSFNSKFGGEKLGEYGGILRWHLVEFDTTLTEVSPATLKKFVTGKGGAKKEMMMLKVNTTWGYEPRGNDDADAYGLWRLGRCCCGLDEPKNAAQREAVATVMGNSF